MFARLLSLKGSKFSGILRLKGCKISSKPEHANIYILSLSPGTLVRQLLIKLKLSNVRLKYISRG